MPCVCFMLWLLISLISFPHQNNTRHQKFVLETKKKKMNADDNSSHYHPSPYTTQLSTVTKVLFSFPQLTSNILNGFIGNHLTRYLVQDLCEHAATSCLSTRRFGTLSSIVGSLGLFLDLFISNLVDSNSSGGGDNNNTTGNRSILLIALTAPIICLANIVLFNVQNLQFWTSTSSSWIHLSILFTVLSVVRNVTPLNLAYNSLGPMISRDCSQAERNSLFAYKHMFSLWGNMIGAFLPSVCIYVLGGDDGLYWQSFYVTVMSLVTLVSYWLMCYHLNTNLKQEKYKNEVSQQSSSSSTTSSQVVVANPHKSSSSLNVMIPNLKQAFSNRAFTALLALFIYEAIRGCLWGGLMPFYLSQVIGLDNVQYEFWGGVVNVTGMVLAMIATPLWQHLSSRLGNYRTWLLSYSLQIPVGIMLFMSIDIGKQQVYRYFFFFIVLCVTGSASGFLLDSIKANAVDYEEMRTGERREASFEACWSLFPRYISLFSNAFSFGIVSYYNTPDFEQRGEYSLQARWVIAVLTSLLPSVTSIVCFYLMYRFPVDDNMHKKVLDGIKKQKDGKEITDPITGERLESYHSKHSDNHASIRHFFNFEVLWYLNDRRSSNTSLYVQWHTIIECLFFVVWVSISSLCGYLFIRDISSGNDQSDMKATIYLWLSSVSFTIAFGFHYARLRTIYSDSSLRKLSTSELSQYLKVKVG